MVFNKFPAGVDVGHRLLPQSPPVAPGHRADVVLNGFGHGLPVVLH